MKRVAALAALVLALTACSDDARPAGGTVQTASSVAVDTPDLQQLREEAGLEACQPGPGGGALPSLTLPCLGGGADVDLAGLRGPMVLNFWASWCDICEQEMPQLQAFHAAYGARVPVLGVDWQDQYPATGLDQLRDRGVTYPSVADAIGAAAETTEFAKINSLPVTFLIDADGEIAYEHVGAVESEAELADLVREHLGVDL